MIDGNGVLAIGAAVTMLTAVAKTVLPADKASALAPYVALALSLVATLVYVASLPVLPGRTDLFPLLVAWLGVFGTATGVYKVAKLTGVA
jgi:hypothetical protein